MKLRSGKIYNFNPCKETNKKRIYAKKPNYKNDLLDHKCSICKIKYKRKNKVVSCSMDNIYKHSFHSKCLQNHIKCQLTQFYSSGHFNCPYCYTRLNKFNLGKVYL